MFRVRHLSWMILYAIVLHISWGLYLIMQGPVGSDYHGGVFWNVFVSMAPPAFWGWMMLAAGLLAFGAIFKKPSRAGVMLLLPQQAILTIGAVGIVLAGFGWSPYDYEISRVMRVAPASVGAFVFHTGAILQYHAPNLWRRLWTRF